MKKIKVVHILNSVGGVDVSLRLIIGNVDTSKFESIVVHGTEDTQKPFLDQQGNPVKEFKLPIQREVRLLKDIQSIRKTISVLKSEKPDIIHAHSAKGGIIARAASLFYKVTVLHTPQAYSYLSEGKGFKRWVFISIERFFKRINSILLASSNSERNRGVKEVHYKPKKALLFNNCIVPITEASFMNPNLSLPEEYICTVGRPSFQKNIEMMIEVMKHLKEIKPNLHLMIMGVGEYSPNKEAVESLINSYNLKQNVTLIPWIEREKIFSIINKAKLYISTARYEGLPYSVIEALALGKACVVTNCDGNRDLIKDDYNGYVVPENSVETMANRIFELLSNDSLRSSMESNASARFQKHFNIENSIGQLEDIYKEFSK